MLDEIGSGDMVQGSLTYFTLGRFNNPNSALALNGGWTYVPSGIYFDTPEFTISVWIYPQNIGRCARLIDFSNSNSRDFTNNIYIRLDERCYTNQYNYTPELAIYSSSQLQVNCISSHAFTFGEWQFFAATFNGSVMRLYINGNQTCQTTTAYTLPTMSRIYNYIGKTSDPFDGYSASILDDLRFYNKRLTQSQILQLMNESQTSNFCC